jgi:ParB family transcriptional regulator, chromosome partitioning protein
MLDKPETRRPVVDIDPARITSRAPRLRKERDDNVKELAASIEQHGQLQPIIVRPRADGDFGLVAGRHRLRAVRKLKLATIRAEIIEADDDQATLIEIDENLVRANLTPAERALHISKRKEIYEKLHPETKQGASGGKGSQNETLSFVKDSAEKTGRGKSTIARDATRGDHIGQEMLEEIAGTSLDQGAELDALAKLPEAERRELVDRAKAGEEVSARTEPAPEPDPAPEPAPELADIFAPNTAWRELMASEQPAEPVDVSTVAGALTTLLRYGRLRIQDLAGFQKMPDPIDLIELAKDLSSIADELKRAAKKKAAQDKAKAKPRKHK